MKEINFKRYKFLPLFAHILNLTKKKIILKNNCIKSSLSNDNELTLSLIAYITLFGFNMDKRRAMRLEIFEKLCKTLNLSFQFPFYIKYLLKKRYIGQLSSDMILHCKNSPRIREELFEVLSSKKYSLLNKYLLHLCYSNPSVNRAIFSDRSTLVMGFTNIKELEIEKDCEYKVITYGLGGCSFFVGAIFHSEGISLLTFHLDPRHLYEYIYDKKIITFFNTNLHEKKNVTECRLIIAGYSYPTNLFWINNLVRQLNIKSRLSVFLHHQKNQDYLNIIYKLKENKLYGVTISSQEFENWKKYGSSFISYDPYEVFSMEDITQYVLLNIKNTC